MDSNIPPHAPDRTSPARQRTRLQFERVARLPMLEAVLRLEKDRGGELHVIPKLYIESPL